MADEDFDEDFNIEDFGDDFEIDPNAPHHHHEADVAAGGADVEQQRKQHTMMEEELIPEVPPMIDPVSLFPNCLRVDGTTPAPIIVNLVAQGHVGIPLDLRALACGTRNVEYDKKRRGDSAIMRLRDPQCVALLRPGGTMMIVGAPNAAAARRATQLIGKLIRKVLNVPSLKKVEFRVKSLQATFDAKHPVRLEELHAAHPDLCSYEPETFCGCTVKLQGPRSNPWYVSCNVYVSGKITFMGARNEHQVMYAFNTLLPMLAPFAQGSSLNPAPSSSSQAL